MSGKRARSGQDEAIGLKKRRFSSAEKKEQTEQTEAGERRGLSDKTYTPKLRAMAKTIAEGVRVEGLGRDEVTQIVKALGDGPLMDRGWMELVPKFDKKPLRMARENGWGLVEQRQR